MKIILILAVVLLAIVLKVIFVNLDDNPIRLCRYLYHFKIKWYYLVSRETKLNRVQSICLKLVIMCIIIIGLPIECLIVFVKYDIIGTFTNLIGLVKRRN